MSKDPFSRYYQNTKKEKWKISKYFWRRKIKSDNTGVNGIKISPNMKN